MRIWRFFKRPVGASSLRGNLFRTVLFNSTTRWCHCHVIVVPSLVDSSFILLARLECVSQAVVSLELEALAVFQNFQCSDNAVVS